MPARDGCHKARDNQKGSRKQQAGPSARRRPTSKPLLRTL